MLNKFQQLIIILWLFLSPCTFVFAQQIQPQSESDNDAEIIEVVNNNQFSSANYQVINQSEFSHSALNLADILKRINGLQIRQISGLGNPVSISIRGSSNKQVQIYIDGQLINDSQFGSFDLNQIPAEHIESIEISKHQAAGTGATPIGGVIRINTFKGAKKHHRLSVALGSTQYREVNGQTNQAIGSHQLQLGANFTESKNDYKYLVPQTFTDSSVSASESLNNNQYEKKAIHLADKWHWQQHEFQLTGQWSQQEKAIPNYQNNSPENNALLATKTLRFGLQHYWDFGNKLLKGMSTELYQQQKDETYRHQVNAQQLRLNHYQTDNQTLAVKWHIESQFFELTPFMNFSAQEFSSQSLLNNQPTLCNGISACDVMAQQKQAVFGTRIDWQADKLPLSSHLLVSQLVEDNQNVATNMAEGLKLSNSQRQLSKELTINYHWHELNNFLSISSGIRTPTLFELFGDRGSFKGNSNLLPEFADSASLGSSWQHEHITLSITGYQQQIDNAIVAIFNASNVGSYHNVSSATLKGIEWQADVNLVKSLSFGLQGHNIRSSTTSEFSAFDGKKLPGIYHHQLQASVRYQLTNHWHINLISQIDRDLYFNRSNKFENNDSNVGSGNPANRKTTDLQLHWQQNQYRVSLAINNVFNSTYLDLGNRPAQGRNFQLKFSLQGL